MHLLFFIEPTLIDLYQLCSRECKGVEAEATEAKLINWYILLIARTPTIHAHC